MTGSGLLLDFHGQRHGQNSTELGYVYRWDEQSRQSFVLHLHSSVFFSHFGLQWFFSLQKIRSERGNPASGRRCQCERPFGQVSNTCQVFRRVFMPLKIRTRWCDFLIIPDFNLLIKDRAQSGRSYCWRGQPGSTLGGGGFQNEKNIPLQYFEKVSFKSKKKSFKKIFFPFVIPVLQAGYMAIPSPRQPSPGKLKYYRGGYITQVVRMI